MFAPSNSFGFIIPFTAKSKRERIAVMYRLSQFVFSSAQGTIADYAVLVERQENCPG
jgi:hypothetical protein